MQYLMYSIDVSKISAWKLIYIYSDTIFPLPSSKINDQLLLLLLLILTQNKKYLAHAAVMTAGIMDANNKLHKLECILMLITAQ
jgi:hypothetical protein